MTRFAESMAEEVIDGKALRHSFESLDDDGSGCICAEELFQELKPLSNELTMADITAHIDECEGSADKRKAGDSGDPDQEDDNKLDYSEYIRLFPVRMRHLKELDDRAVQMREHAMELNGQFHNVKGKVREWIAELERESSSIHKIAMALDSNSEAQVKELKKRLTRIAQLLSRPPGPYDTQRQAEIYSAEYKKKKKASKENAPPSVAAVYGFESFLQDHAVHSFWPVLIDAERKMVKTCINAPGSSNSCVDVVKAADCVHYVIKKIREVLEWSRFQIEEYESLLDVFENTEPPMNSLMYSSRGLQNHDRAPTGDGN